MSNFCMDHAGQKTKFWSEPKETASWGPEAQISLMVQNGLRTVDIPSLPLHPHQDIQDSQKAIFWKVVFTLKHWE